MRYALARGHKVTLFNRGRQPKAWPGEVEELLGDRNTGDLKALDGREWDVCIDNPTTLPFWVRDAGKVLQGKVQQYVFISTISVYAANDKPEDETAALLRYDGADPMAETIETLRAKPELYGPLKAASEAEARRQFGAATTIIRPGLIVGPGDETDRFTYWPVRLARGGEVLAPGDGSDPVQFIDARDLAEWTIRMAETRTTGIFNATGPARALAMREMLAGIAAATPRRRAAHLGAGRLPGSAAGLGLDRPAGLGAGPRRQRRLRAAQHRPRAAGRAHLPAAGDDGGRHAGLVQAAAGSAPGQAEDRAHAGARGRGAERLEGEREEAGVGRAANDGRAPLAAVSAHSAHDHVVETSGREPIPRRRDVAGREERQIGRQGRRPGGRVASRLARHRPSR